MDTRDSESEIDKRPLVIAAVMAQDMTGAIDSLQATIAHPLHHHPYIATPIRNVRTLAFHE
jgi:hypothetical protein